ncbi:EsaB/YukD family protein [Pseudogracilibacillus sp. SE30717A]|uniref:EsaB/YukD family protein n=1 Tax=Pseudogracilibacillus sp. SE30717A TaxID=3098293 RepID=UPI00300E20F3
MIKETHINVTVDFSNWGANVYDLRIPKHQTVKQLLINLQDTLGIQMPNQSRFVIKVPTKQLVLADDDSLLDYPVADGDIFIAL